jgi:hypothetical protein
VRSLARLLAARSRTLARGLASALCSPLALALAVALVLGLFALCLDTHTAWAASPSPGPAASPGIIGSGDPRSNGQGPGLVGSPFAIAVGVVLLGLLAAGGTLLYLRITRDE